MRDDGGNKNAAMTDRGVLDRVGAYPATGRGGKDETQGPSPPAANHLALKEAVLRASSTLALTAGSSGA